MDVLRRRYDSSIYPLAAVGSWIDIFPSNPIQNSSDADAISRIRNAVGKLEYNVTKNVLEREESSIAVHQIRIPFWEFFLTREHILFRLRRNKVSYDCHYYWRFFWFM